ncbi:MAG: class I SAM-dependent methyltransferase [Candidatus Diapherotrites archaeon]|nr:class I SAM-dependent methyltransferase [Candidatus Diapherotrites archaeon]
MNPIELIGQLIPESIKCGTRDAIVIKYLKENLTDERTLLDCGCGTGRLGKKIQDQLGLDVYGVDIRFPKPPLIPAKEYDGTTLPFKDNHFDVVLIVDVLHHTNDPDAMLKEILRVAKKTVIIKDHYYVNSLDRLWVSFMDVMGNIADGTPTPFNFYSLKKWQEIKDHYQVKIHKWRGRTLCPHLLLKISKKKL